jgi:pimeloyl-ACP methyl ester carboxylesterase
MRPEPIFFPMPDGGVIAGEESGDPAGAPVFFFHGWPASRLQGAGFGPAARELGIRIIALDRPGVGCSSFREGRRLVDWPPVVGEVSRQLGLERFRVIGISGGGPYALVSAWGLPEQVEAAAVVCGAPPIPAGDIPPEFFLVYRWMLRLYRRWPRVLRSFFSLARPLARQAPPMWLVLSFLRVVSRADYEALRDREVYAGTFECYQEAWRGSAVGVAVDGELYAEPWGFAPEETQVPVRLWHGSADRNFAAPLAEALGARIPGCVTRIIPGEGHYSLPFRHASEILKDLLQARPAAMTVP